MMRNPWIIALALALLLSGTPSKAADDSTFLIPETDIIKAMQAAVRADDKDWFVAHLHYPVRYYGKAFHMITVEGLVSRATTRQSSVRSSRKRFWRKIPSTISRIIRV